jgi:hypothetical protein
MCTSYSFSIIYINKCLCRSKKKLTAMDEHATRIKSEDDAKIAAQKIFENVARRNELIRFMI